MSNPVQQALSDLDDFLITNHGQPMTEQVVLTISVMAGKIALAAGHVRHVSDLGHGES